jgi:hypothetical protein
MLRAEDWNKNRVVDSKFQVDFQVPVALGVDVAVGTLLACVKIKRNQT